ncbi:MAG TPA: hypothetical protein VL177_16365 [Terriglobales bacterium]|jgi:hypothetical protein|nr:hypothetical protein [Terriglobales bacterium]
MTTVTAKHTTSGQQSRCALRQAAEDRREELYTHGRYIVAELRTERIPLDAAELRALDELLASHRCQECCGGAR